MPDHSYSDPDPLRGIVYKTQPESVISSTVLQDDNELKFNVLANLPYYLEAFILYTSTSGAGDFKHAFALSTGTFNRGWRKHYGAGTTTFTAQEGVIVDMTTAINNACVIEDALVKVDAYFVVSADAELRFQWAQQASDATNVTVQPGSFIRYQRLR